MPPTNPAAFDADLSAALEILHRLLDAARHLDPPNDLILDAIVTAHHHAVRASHLHRIDKG